MGDWLERQVVSAVAMESPAIPSVPETVRSYARRFFLGDASGWRGTPLTLVLFVGAVLMVAPVSSTEQLLPVALAIFVAVAAIDSAYREYLFGGSTELLLAAALTTGVIASALFLPFVALRGVVGGPPFPSLDAVVALGVLGFGVAYFGRRGSRKRAETAFEEQVQAERAKRGAAPTG